MCPAKSETSAASMLISAGTPPTETLYFAPCALNLSDRVVDIVNEGVDCAVRLGDLPDSSLVSVRLADNRRLCVATPDYLARAGTPLARVDDPIELTGQRGRS